MRVCVCVCVGGVMMRGVCGGGGGEFSRGLRNWSLLPEAVCDEGEVGGVFSRLMRNRGVLQRG